MAALKFVAEVYKVQTLVDGGIRVTFDLSENSIAQAAALMECKRNGIVLSVECAAESDIQSRNRSNGKVQARTKWQS